MKILNHVKKKTRIHLSVSFVSLFDSHPFGHESNIFGNIIHTNVRFTSHRQRKTLIIFKYLTERKSKRNRIDPFSVDFVLDVTKK